MNLCIVCIRQQLSVVVPAGLMSRDMMSETCHDRSVELLNLAVALGVICSRGHVFNDQTDSGCFRELGNDLYSISGKKIRQNTVWDDPIIDINGRCILRGHNGDWYGPSRIFISVCQEN